MARVYGGVATPRLVQFNLAPAPGVKLVRIVALADDLALALGAAQCRIQRKGTAVCVEVPRGPGKGGQDLFSLADALPQAPPCTALLGMDEEGTPLLLRLSSPEIAHVLIAGITGSGKTELARSMIASLARANPPEKLRLILIDPKGRAFRDFADLPHLVCPIITAADEAVERLKGLAAEMERRDRAGQSEPRVAVFLDELADLMLVAGKSAEQVMTRLVQRGREAGIHVVACTQRPAAVVMGSMVKANFPCRLVGRVASPEDAKVATGIKGSGAERLQGRGDFLLVARGEVKRLQVARANPGDIRSLAGASAVRSPALYPASPRAVKPANGAALPAPSLSQRVDNLFLRLVK